MLEIRTVILTMVVPASALKKLMHIHADFGKPVPARKTPASIRLRMGLPCPSPKIRWTPWCPAFLRERVRSLRGRISPTSSTSSGRRPAISRSCQVRALPACAADRDPGP